MTTGKKAVDGKSNVYIDIHSKVDINSAYMLEKIE